MPEREQFRLFEFKRSDCHFLKKVGIKPCLIDDAFAGLLPTPLRKDHPVSLTEMDTRWLKACGIAWEREAEVQLSLDFCERRATVQET